MAPSKTKKSKSKIRLKKKSSSKVVKNDSITKKMENIDTKLNVIRQLVAMRSDTQSVRSVIAEDRENRIRQALELVIKDVEITQGEVNAKKAAAALDNPETKEHVGTMLDSLTSRRKQVLKKFQPQAKTSLRIPPDVGEAVLNGSNQPDRIQFANFPAAVMKAATNKKSRVLKIKRTPSAKKSSVKALADFAIPVNFAPVKFEPPVKRPTTRGNKSKSTPPVQPQPSNSNQAPRPTTPKKAEATKGAAAAENTKNSSSAVNKTDLYQAKIDLNGFANGNIALDLDGRRLIVVAFRPKDKLNHAQKITEVIDIPENVNLDHLEVGRRQDGFLVVEELAEKKSPI